jgi:hypothetical protein
LVLVDDAGEDWPWPCCGVDRGDDAGIVVGWVLIQALVWTVVVEVRLILTQHCAGVPFVVDQHPVRAPGADTTDEPLRVAVCHRRPRRSLDHVHVVGCEHGVQGPGELGVPVADKQPQGGDPIAEIHHRVAGQLRGPRGGRVFGDAEDVDPRLVAISMTTSTYSLSRLMVSTWKKSAANSPHAYAGRKVRQLVSRSRGAGPVLPAARTRRMAPAPTR